MTIRRLLTFALVLPLLAAAACHRNDHDDDEFVETIPGGGVDFGLFQQFEHDFADFSIADSQDLDGFEFSLAEDSTILIAITGSGGFDGFVDLYTAGFVWVAGDDDGGPGLDALLVGSLDAGDYFAVVGGSGGSVGDYSIDISVASLGGADLGAFSPPDSILLTGNVIDDAFDDDTFFFTIDVGSTVDIFVTQDFAGDFDANLQLVDQFGQQVNFVDPAGNADPVLLGEVLAAGTYMAIVGSGSGGGGYEIFVDMN